MKYVDAHCHLESNVLPADIAVAITNATHPADWATVARYTGWGGVYGAIGVHPWCVSDLPAAWPIQMRELLMANPKLMVGEIGLDKNHPDMATQIDIFTAQLQMAAVLGRVVHIHCVGAWDKLLGALATVAPPAFVLHGTNASPEIIRALARYNAYFSFGRAIGEPAHRRAREALQTVPQNRILSESDSDNPMDVIGVAQKMSEILARPLADVTETIYNNAVELLKNG